MGTLINIQVHQLEGRDLLITFDHVAGFVGLECIICNFLEVGNETLCDFQRVHNLNPAGYEKFRITKTFKTSTLSQDDLLTELENEVNRRVAEYIASITIEPTPEGNKLLVPSKVVRMDLSGKVVHMSNDMYIVIPSGSSIQRPNGETIEIDWEDESILVIPE